MKIPLFILSALCVAISASAAPNQANLYHTDGSITKLVFSESLKVTCPDNETLRFSDGKGTEIDLPHSDIHHVSYDGIGEISSPATSSEIRIDGRRLILENLNNTTTATVYDTTGHALITMPCHSETVLDFNDFPAGTYIISAGKFRLKISI